MLSRKIFLGVFGGCAGLLVSGGVFTVLISIGLIPRFAGKTHSGNKIFLYEEFVIFGTIIGCIISIFDEQLQIGQFLARFLGENVIVLGNIVLSIYGFFSGIFVGCLALAIAEMLNSIPIFARRIGFRHGLGIAILSMALGKLAGSVYYFMNQYWVTMYK